MFAGTGAIISNDVHSGAVTHVGIALTFGLVVLAMIYAIGDISGAHINPAVTIAFTVAGRFPVAKAVPYVVCQCAGAILASLLLRGMFPDHELLGATLPAAAVYQAFVMEVVLTFMLMFVILSVSTGAMEEGVTAGLAIGAVVGPGSIVWRTGLRCIDESRPLDWPGTGRVEPVTFVGVHPCSHRRGPVGGANFPSHA